MAKRLDADVTKVSYDRYQKLSAVSCLWFSAGSCELGITMANTTAVYARIDTSLKEKAENILRQLGISPSGAIHMLYSQIVRIRALPFDLHLHYRKPTAIGGMSDEELDAELNKGFESLKEGKVYTADEVDRMLKDEFQL